MKALRLALALALAGAPRLGTAQEAEPAGEREPPRIERRRPGDLPGPPAPEYRAPAPASPYDVIAVTDRWRIVEALGVNERWWDPYHQNTWKGDRPVFGDDWFVNLLLVSDTLVEPRRVPTPVGLQANVRNGALDAFGDGEQLLLAQNLIHSVSLIKGDTVFRPPDWELRFAAVMNWNYTVAEVVGLLNADPTEGRRRYDSHYGVQELFVDRHLRNKSDRYDFDSLRVGIQPFISDFRGFVFQDEQLGARLFGTFRNNRIQYNLAWFRRIEKDTNSALNRGFDLRRDDVLVANVYYQDFPVLGFQLQGTAIWNHNAEDERRAHFNRNDFLVRPPSVGEERPHGYDAIYLGLNGDGHFDRLNLTFAAYYLTGTDDRNPIARRGVDLDAFFLAAEASVDRDWYRLKAFGLWSSGDEDPFDGRGEGFDAVFENPQFAGADTSFWVRQEIPFIGGGGVIVSGRNALIPSLRSSKEEGQSNFVNPGLRMLGVGADFDILPQLRVVVNVSSLRFDATSSLRVLRNMGRIDRHIGEDYSIGLLYRPGFIENVVVRLSAARLQPGRGFDQIFDDRGERTPFYSVLANVLLTY